MEKSDGSRKLPSYPLPCSRLERDDKIGEGIYS